MQNSRKKHIYIIYISHSQWNQEKALIELLSRANIQSNNLICFHFLREASNTLLFSQIYLVTEILEHTQDNWCVGENVIIPWRHSLWYWKDGVLHCAIIICKSVLLININLTFINVKHVHYSLLGDLVFNS